MILGKLLYALKRLMRNLSSLRDLRLVDLMLDTNEALQLLDDVCYSHCLTMQSLELVNISKVQCPLLHVGVFLNLQVCARIFSIFNLSLLLKKTMKKMGKIFSRPPQLFFIWVHSICSQTSQYRAWPCPWKV